jgi:hypothetical protein
MNKKEIKNWDDVKKVEPYKSLIQEEKQKAREEELEFLKKFKKYCYEKSFAGGCIYIDERITQIQEEFKKK